MHNIFWTHYAKTLTFDLIAGCVIIDTHPGSISTVRNHDLRLSFLAMQYTESLRTAAESGLLLMLIVGLASRSQLNAQTFHTEMMGSSSRALTLDWGLKPWTPVESPMELVPQKIRKNPHHQHQTSKLAETPDLNGSVQVSPIFTFVSTVGMVPERNCLGAPALEWVPYAKAHQECVGFKNRLVGGEHTW